MELFLSSGAGNPNIYQDEIKNIEKLINANIPIFAFFFI